jgi:hypothetical protein
MNSANLFKKILFNRLFHHLIFWSVIFVGLDIINRSEFITTPNLIIFYLLLPLPVYLHFYFLDKFFNKKKYHIYVILLPPLILLSAILLRSRFTEKMQAFNGLFTFTINITIFLFITTGLKFLKSNFNKKILIQQQQTTQLLAEMELVKTRINPVFMRNILSHLYHLSLEKSPQVPNLILQFSEMLRYTIESSRKVTIELSEELHYIKQYLLLEEQINKHQIKIRAHGNLRKKILPLILVSPVEKILTEINNTTKKPISGEIQIGIDEKTISLTLKMEKSDGIKHLSTERNGLKNRASQHFSANNTIFNPENGDTRTTVIQISQNQLIPHLGLKKLEGK